MIEEKEAQDILELLTEIAEMMMSSGAHSARIIRTLERFATGLGYHCELVLTYTGILISVYKHDTFKTNTLARTFKEKGINFETLSEISILSWKVLDHKMTISEIKSALENIKSKKVYSKLQLYLFAPLASVALCMLFDGDWIQGIIIYISTLVGLYARKTLAHKHYNSLLGAFIASALSTLIIHFFGVLFNFQVDQALITSILYLIPGVIMINSFIDYLEGYFESGTARFIFSSMVILMLALGFFTSNIIFNINSVKELLLFDFSNLQQQVRAAYAPTGFSLQASKLLFGGITSLGFALIFNTSKRALWTVFLLGALGYYIKYLLSHELGENQILSIFIASTFVGISGMYFAHRTHTPPIIFMIPAVINMIPGLVSYKFMMGMINWISNTKGEIPVVEDVIGTFSYGITTLFILYALAFGIAFPIIVFKSETAKGNDLNVIIKKIFRVTNPN